MEMSSHFVHAILKLMNGVEVQTVEASCMCIVCGVEQVDCRRQSLGRNAPFIVSLMQWQPENAVMIPCGTMTYWHTIVQFHVPRREVTPIPPTPIRSTLPRHKLYNPKLHAMHYENLS
jgi:hypothetical protein